ncbi:hypothetical protein H9W90_02400 [Polaribacter pectinis]|uniref:Uncharacterized protein n=1 Tax=Polaribacter pectinis TaxID=2738844 RepID=A0A7G9LBI5_9FLAO|nr:hypothetical protein [Polaribacter pectinis]QNM85984.1 hypothetical protein H9W90_02400 [Polaribacter pectinis]
MTDEEIAELMKYSSPNELYIVNGNGKLECLKCPFRVKLKYNIGELYKDDVVLVNKVKITKDLQSVYVIRNKAYYSQHFIII